ncbi:MATE family efflux transporter [Paenibacillus glycanilyticus]|uniref:Probable multidrug resistance protein NorM n=1 Tax=Paenibacillus glycanilyticus TaxID=126569 RepID=A0ABQ6G8D3_9BACL|nr:MATE family efflux transporter [Paenibacillus glycanilyticus]GLX67213.1 MATE family multidrug exporter [Paenibacillus glycanilyticus]
MGIGRPRLKGKHEAFLERHFTGVSIDYRQIIALFIPILIDQAFIIGLNLLNTAMVSSSGVDAVSAVNMVDSLNIFLISVFIAVSTGGTVVVAQYKGSGNHQMVSKSAASSVASVTLVALAISLIVVAFHNPMLRLLFGSASPDVLEEGRTYLIGSGLSYVGIAMMEAVCGALRGIGRSRASLMLSLVMNFSYVAMNIVFINLMNMGVLGLSISVNISRYAAAVLAIVYLVKIDTSLRIRLRDMLSVNIAMLRKILFVGLPFAAEQMFFNGGKIVTQTFVVSLGTYAIATNAISGSLANVLQIPSNALAITAITVIGQCMGQRNIEDARKFTRSFLWLSTACLFIMSCLMLPFFYPLVGLFHPPAEIVDDIFIITLVNAIMQVIFWSISFIMPSALRAAGDSKFTSVVSLLSMWLFRIVLGYLLAIVFDFGILGVWFAMNLEWGVRGAVFLWRFRGKKWYRHRLID